MSRRPPSVRDPEYAANRLGRAVQSMAPGSAGGRVLNAAPVRGNPAARVRGGPTVLAGTTGATGVYLQDRIVAGAAAVGTDVAPPGIRVPVRMLITSVVVWVRVAPTGSGLTVRLRSGGVDVGTVTVPAGATTASTAVSFAADAGAIVLSDVTAVGSTAPGSDVAVALDGIAVPVPVPAGDLMVWAFDDGFARADGVLGHPYQDTNDGGAADTADVVGGVMVPRNTSGGGDYPWLKVRDNSTATNYVGANGEVAIALGWKNGTASVTGLTGEPGSDILFGVRAEQNGLSNSSVSPGFWLRIGAKYAEFIPSSQVANNLGAAKIVGGHEGMPCRFVIDRVYDQATDTTTATARIERDAGPTLEFGPVTATGIIDAIGLTAGGGTGGTGGFEPFYCTRWQVEEYSGPHGQPPA